MARRNHSLRIIVGPLSRSSNYSIKGLSDAQAALDRLYQAIRISEDNVYHNALPGVSVLDALADDLNTPLALSELHKLAGALNKASNNEVKNKIRSELLGRPSFWASLMKNRKIGFVGAH